MLLPRRNLDKLGNKPYSDKSKVYSQSKFLLTKCQQAKPALGKSDQVTRISSEVESFDAWTRETVEERQAFLSAIARRVWNVPKRIVTAGT